jgi:hypothetical protein
LPPDAPQREAVRGITPPEPPGKPGGAARANQGEPARPPPPLQVKLSLLRQNGQCFQQKSQRSSAGKLPAKRGHRTRGGANEDPAVVRIDDIPELSAFEDRFRKALDRNERFAEAHNNLACTLRKQGPEQFFGVSRAKNWCRWRVVWKAQGRHPVRKDAVESRLLPNLEPQRMQPGWDMADLKSGKPNAAFREKNVTAAFSLRLHYLSSSPPRFSSIC